MRVFISHSRQNSGAALRICDRLTARGVHTWLDIRELESGTDWNQQVADAIASSDGFVILIGPATTPDQSQRFEWQQMADGEYYLDPQKPIIPVVMGTADVPGFLRARMSIDVAESPIDYDVLTDTIVKALATPESTVDQAKLERGRAARQNALDSLKDYSRALEEGDVKHAAIRGLK
jgi:hypothetical protein